MEDPVKEGKKKKEEGKREGGRETVEDRSELEKVQHFFFFMTSWCHLVSSRNATRGLGKAISCTLFPIGTCNEGGAVENG